MFSNASLALAVLTGAAPQAQTAAPAKPKAIDPANFDTTAKPCEDFYQLRERRVARRAPDPGRPQPVRRFDELSDRNRDVVKKILEETSAKTDWPKGSPEQKVSDFYATGMDAAAAIEKAGAAPLAPTFATIAKLKTADDLPAVLAELHLSGVNAGFGFRVAQDARNSHALHRDPEPGRPRPPRPRLLPQGRPEVEGPARGVPRPRREDARARRRHTGDGEGRGRRRAWRSRRSSRRPRSRASRTATRRRPTTRGPSPRSNAEAAGFDFTRFLADLGRLRGRRGQRPPARASSRRFAALARSVPPAEWRTYLRWHAARSRGAASSRRPSRTRTSPSTGRSSTARPSRRSAGGASRPRRTTALGEAVGPIYVARAFSPQAKERMKRPRREHARRAQGAHRGAPVDERRDEGPGPEEARRLRREDRLPGHLARLLGARDLARRPVSPRTSAARRVFETKRNLAKLGKPIDRTEWGMTPPTVNAYYNSIDERDRLPGRHPPAAVLLRGRGRRRELRRDRRRDRPRDDARLRRLGQPVRRGRQPQELVDAGGPQGLRGAHGAHREAVRRLQAARRTRPSTASSRSARTSATSAASRSPTRRCRRRSPGKPQAKIDGFTPEQRFFLSYATIWRSQYRDEAHARPAQHEPAQPRALARDRPALEPARVLRRVRLRRGRADAPRGGRPAEHLVADGGAIIPCRCAASLSSSPSSSSPPPPVTVRGGIR